MSMLNQSQMLLQVRQLLSAGNYPQATSIVRGMMSKPGGKKNPKLLAYLAECQLGELEVDKALETIGKAIKLEPRNPMHRTIRGQALLHSQRHEEALAAYKEALKLNPGWPSAVRGLTEVYFLLNEPEQAYDFLKPILSADRMDPQVALAFTRICANVGKAPEGVALLECWVDDERFPPEQRRPGLFQLGALYDKMGRYDDAFETYHKANKLRPGKFHAARHRATTDRVIAGTTRETLDALPEPDTKSDKPIFIVGMPRSGTSLVEQALSCHRRIFGAGELTAIDDIVQALSHSDMARLPREEVQRYVEKFATGYLGLLKRLGRGADFVTDKNPLNFKHLGVISKVLPGARIIHCVRNPLDTCVSNYFHNFIGRTAFSDNLADLGSFYNDYRRLMEHWKSVVSIPILDVVYEDVVEDFESNARRIIEFLELDWDPEILRFHESKRITHTASTEQVRKPIYKTSAQRWKRYERHLDPLIEALDPQFRPQERVGEG